MSGTDGTRRRPGWRIAHREAWRDTVLTRQLSRRAVKRARVESLVLLPLLAGVLLIYTYRDQLFGREWDTTVRAFTAVALVSLGWQLARDIGRAIGPTLLQRLDPPTAGTIGFLVRLLALLAAVVIALHVSGLSPKTLALSGAVTAVVVGLAAQQTLGNLIAGMVIISARIFRVGERIRLQGGGLAGSVEGVVRSMGLLHTTFARGDDAIMVPNSVVLSVAVVPLREPAGVDIRVRLRPGVTPVQLQELLEREITVPTRGPGRIVLEEFDADETVVRVTATPARAQDGAEMATQVLRAVRPLTTGKRSRDKERGQTSQDEQLEGARRSNGGEG